MASEREYHFLNLSDPSQLSRDDQSRLCLVLEKLDKTVKAEKYSTSKGKSGSKNKKRGCQITFNGRNECIFLTHPVIRNTNPESRIGYFILGDEVGRGSFGRVRSAVGINIKNQTITTVATDLLIKISERQQTESGWLDEAKINQTVYGEGDLVVRDRSSQLTQDKKPTTPKAYMSMKNLGEINLSDINFAKLSYGEKLEIAIALAEAMEKFHKKGFIHRDIKQDNFVYDFNKKIFSLIDFNFAAKPEKNGVAAGLCGNLAYIAPELKDSISTQASDIYSFGGVLAYLFSGGNINVYKNKWDAAITYQNKIISNSKLAQEREKFMKTPFNLGTIDNKYKNIKSLLQEMTADNGERRPTISAVLTELRRLQSDLLFSELMKLKKDIDNLVNTLKAKGNQNQYKAKLDLIENLRKELNIDSINERTSNSCLRSLHKVAFDQLAGFINDEKKISALSQYLGNPVQIFFMKMLDALTLPITKLMIKIKHDPTARLVKSHSLKVVHSLKELADKNKSLTLDRELPKISVRSRP